MSDKKTVIRSILGRLFKWGKKHLEEEIEAEVRARVERRLSGSGQGATNQPGPGSGSPGG